MSGLRTENTLMKWISVKDRLPNDHERVLGWRQEGEMQPSYMVVVSWSQKWGNWWAVGGLDFKNEIEISYWMPLPDKPSLNT